MGFTKRCLSGFLCLVLLLSLLPGTVFATEVDWAESAVERLNEIYGEILFSAEDTKMTVKDARAVLNGMGCSTDQLAGQEDDLFTRGMACTVLADAFQMAVKEDMSAIQYFYELNLINGIDQNNLDENGPVCQAEFAILTYRVLNHMGGGMGSVLDGLKPGTDEYYAWLYLAVRLCAPFFEENINQPIESVTIETYTGSSDEPRQEGDREIYTVYTGNKTGEEIWDAWEMALGDTHIGGIENFTAVGYDPEDTLLQAATKIVNQFAQQKYQGNVVIFHDVTMGDWFYDGIMYLTDRQYVIGYSDGQFGPNDMAPRYEFAALLSVVDGTVPATDPDRLGNSIRNVLKKGYMAGSGQEDESGWNPFQDDYWTGFVTREEAVVGILKMLEETENLDTTSDNLAILDRFTDQNQIVSDESRPYLAYAVSMGMLSGIDEKTLSPRGETERVQLGILLYRTLIGVDRTKMKDYEEQVDWAMEGATVQTLGQVTELSAGEKRLTLREDWHLTAELDLAVPAGTTLIIDGNGHYLYEMDGGQLLNSGLGKVTFTDGTILYPSGAEEACDSNSSNQLMMDRQPHTVTVGASANGTVTAAVEKAEKGETVTLTIRADSGYQLDRLTYTATEISGSQPVEIVGGENGYSFTMPASDVTVSATFTEIADLEGPAAPAFSPAGGTYSSAQRVTVTAEDGAEVYYTTDGMEPTLNSTCYTQPISITATTVLKAIAVKDGQVSEETAAMYTILTEGRYNGIGKISGHGDHVNLVFSGGAAANSWIENALSKADENATVTISTADSTAMEIPAGALAAVVENKSDIQVKLQQGQVALPASVIADVIEGESTDSSMCVAVTSITSSQQEALSGLLDEGASVFQVLLSVEGNVVSSLEGDLTISFTVSDLEEMAEPVVLQLFPDGSSKDITPASISGDTITIEGIRELSVFAVISGVERSEAQGMPFTDVREQGDALDVVTWAVENGITNGTGSTGFSPDETVTRGQLVTFLWRSAGSPSVAGGNPFTDINVDDFYYDAVLWAVENGITNGTGEKTFSPEVPVTRAQAVTFLWRAAGSPAASDNGFEDVAADAYYAGAVDWAAENGITNGTGNARFSPDAPISRAQAITLLYREQK